MERNLLASELLVHDWLNSVTNTHFSKSLKVGGSFSFGQFFFKSCGLIRGDWDQSDEFFLFLRASPDFS